MDLQLKGKRVLITGSNSGIGAGIAKTLAAEGATVVIHGRDAARADQIAAEIATSGGQAVVALGDLATEAGCVAVGDKVMQALGGIDILVNNAGGRACSHRRDGQAGSMNPPWLDISWSNWL